MHLATGAETEEARGRLGSSCLGQARAGQVRFEEHGAIGWGTDKLEKVAAAAVHKAPRKTVR